MEYDVTWERVDEKGQLICKKLDVRTLVARLIKASKNGSVIIHSIQRSK